MNENEKLEDFNSRLNLELWLSALSIISLLTIFFVQNNMIKIFVISYIIWYVLYTFTNNYNYIYISLGIWIITYIVLSYIM